MHYATNVGKVEIIPNVDSYKNQFVYDKTIKEIIPFKTCF